jgi:acetyl-CoA acetyltransferase family protein
MSDAQTRAIARYIVLKAGLPIDVSGIFVEMQCGSAITSLNHAVWRILTGMSEVAIVGGMESYSTYTAKMSTSQTPYQGIAPTPVRLTLTPNKERDVDMLTVSDLMAKTWKISREACDEFAYNSQKRLQEAYQTGLIGPEIVPYIIPATKKTPEVTVDKDEFPRANTTIEGLAKLKAIHEGGVTTAGNSSGRNDGAAFLLVMTTEKAKEYGYEPYAKWVGCAHAGCQENLMGIGPSYSNQKAFKQLGLKIKDIDVFECNEAFAAQNLSVIKDMQESLGEKIDLQKWNPNGGAIAIGHPNGASGSRITWFAMKQLEKTGGKYGCISSCCGGGLGTTVIIENLRR